MRSTPQGWRVTRNGKIINGSTAHYDRLMAQRDMMRRAGAPTTCYAGEFDIAGEAIDELMETDTWTSHPTTSETCSSSSILDTSVTGRCRCSHPRMCLATPSCSSSTSRSGSLTTTSVAALTA